MLLREAEKQVFEIRRALYKSCESWAKKHSRNGLEFDYYGHKIHCPPSLTYAETYRTVEWQNMHQEGDKVRILYCSFTSFIGYEGVVVGDAVQSGEYLVALNRCIVEYL